MLTIVAVIGSGNMGTALAQVIADNGYSVKIWSIEKEVLKEIAERHTNKKYLPGVKLSKNINSVFSLADCLQDASIIILAVPSAVAADVTKQIRPHLRQNQLLISFIKGLQADSGRDMHSLISAELSKNFKRNILIASGPSIASEFARKKPTRVVVAGTNKNNFKKIKQVLANNYFGLTYSSDIIGTELGGVLKNVYAIALGICDGGGYGINTKAILVSQALAEMAEFIIKQGGKKESAYGLAGLGDLLTTGFSPFSRNRTFGEKICIGKSCQKTLENMSQVVEGVPAVKIIYHLARKHKIKMPLMGAIYGALYQDKDPAEVLQKFLRQEL